MAGTSSGTRFTTLMSPIRLAFAVYPPATNECAFHSHLEITSTCLFPGLVAERIGIIMKAAKLEFQLVPLPDALRVNGTVQGLYQFYNTHQVHTGVNFWTPSRYRLENYLTSTTIIEENELAATAVLTKDRSESEYFGLFTFVRIFEPSVWLALILFCVFIRVFRHLLQNRQTGARTLNFSLAWMGFFLASFMALYRSGILSRIIIEERHVRFTDLEHLTELYENRAIEIIPVSSRFRHNLKNHLREFTGNVDHHGQKLYRLMARHDTAPDIETFGSMKEALEHTLTSGDSLFGNEKILTGIARSYCDVEVVVFEGLQPVERSVMLFSLDTDKKLIQRINHAIKGARFTLNSVVYRYQNQVFKRKATCKSMLEPNNTAQTQQGVQHPNHVQLQHLLGLIIVYLLLAVLSIAICCLEKIIFNCEITGICIQRK